MRKRSLLGLSLILGMGLLIPACGGGGGGGGALETLPVARLSISPSSGPVPLVVSYDGTASTDPDGGPLTYLWEFSNGETAQTAKGSVTFVEAGTMNARLTVTNQKGRTGAQQMTWKVGGDWQESSAHRILYLTNLERKAHGVPPLKGQVDLDTAACAHAFDMGQNNYFSHTSQDGRNAGTRITAAGYAWNTYGENIAAGYGTPEAVLGGWNSSSGHHANIVSPSYRELGVGCGNWSRSTFGHYWVQDFGARDGIYPVVIEDEAFSTASRTVNLYIYGTGWASQMMISEEPSFTGANWEPFAATPQIQLPEGAGLKHIYVRIKNSAGTEKTATDEIVLQ